MAQGSSFWQWYARVNDDARHQLIDRAWFGQHQRDNAFERDVDAMAGRGHEAPSEQHAAVYGRGPQMPEAGQGIDAPGRAGAKDTMKELYGRSHGGMDAPQQQRDAGRAGGPEQER